MLDFGRFEVMSFDCYGTLIDWESGILDALRSILATHDLFASDDELLSFYAEAESRAEAGPFVPYRDVLRSAMVQVLRRQGVEASAAEADYLVRSLKDWPAFPDTVEALRTLKKRFRLAVISNTDDELFALTAKHLGVDFDWVVTAEQARAYKPDPRAFTFALGQIGLPKERILHVAQSLYHDIEPAKNLGLSAVWLNRRQGQAGSGATPPAQAAADLEVPDLRTLAALTSPR